jgi:hypothetical protein
MTALTKMLIAGLVSLYAWVLVDPSQTSPTTQAVPATVPATTHYSPAVATTTPTPTTTAPLPAAGDCDGWVAIAWHVGWPDVALDTLERAMRLESGCDPAAVGDNGKSVGLLQIHMPSWCTPNRYWPAGWMQTHGLGDCQSLYDPITNLRVGLAMWEGWTGARAGWHHWHALQ